MSIHLISISHKVAPLKIRERFAFTKEEQIQIMKKFTETDGARECVILSTCNRTELYVYNENEKKKRSIYEDMENALLEKIENCEEEHISDYVRFYSGRKAIEHLFFVAAGLDSMVIGEDQILGQVKQAHQTAMEEGTCSVYLNTLFRYAVTAAKKVKTDTRLSKTSVSTASLAVKAADEALLGLKEKNIMIIGASGKIGSIVLKNLQSISGANIYVTTRNTLIQKECDKHHGDYCLIPYNKRYDYVDVMDVIISSTASPHYTMSYQRVLEAVHQKKTRVFIDLAVPMDIEAKVEKIDGVKCWNIDDFTELAKKNNEIRKKEALSAENILEEYEIQFEKWMIFQKGLPVMREIKKEIVEDASSKGIEKAIDKLFYRVREAVEPAKMEVFFECLKEEKK